MNLFRSAAACVVLGLCAASASPASAGDTVPAREPVAIANVIPNAPGMVPARALGAECEWRSSLSRRIVADADGRVVATSRDLDALAGRVLVLQVTQLQVGAGGRWSSKGSWILLHGELRQDGRRVETFDFRRTWVKGWTGCSTAEKIVTMLAADVAGWIALRDAPPVPAAIAPEKTE